jgi:hypothetical protein
LDFSLWPRSSGFLNFINIHRTGDDEESDDSSESELGLKDLYRDDLDVSYTFLMYFVMMLLLSQALLIYLDWFRKGK